MKKILRNFSFVLVLAVIIALSSCSKDEPLPLATAGFEVTTIAPEVHVPVHFLNNSLNADYYVWDFGDGTQFDSAESVSTVHIYEEPGDYSVKLRAYNQDGAFHQAEMNVEVGERFLTSFRVVALGDEDLEGNKFVMDTIRGIDLMMAVGPSEDGDRFLDLPLILDSVGVKRSLPTGFLLNEDYLLTNENYLIFLFRVDSTDDETIYRTALDAVEFNPLNENISFKEEDGLGGIIVPLLAGFGYQYLLEFEIK